MNDKIIVTEALGHTVVTENPVPSTTIELLNEGPQGPPGPMGEPEVITQAEYDLLDPKDPSKVYYIVG